MATRTRVLKWTALPVGLVFIAGGVVFAYSHLGRAAQPILPGSSLEQAKELSKGRKGICLPPSQQAAQAVNADDSHLEWNGEKISKFETAAGFALMDVPAGTDYEVNVNSYEAGVAKGSMVYKGGYGAYNYEIKKSSTKGEWALVGATACSG